MPLRARSAAQRRLLKLANRRKWPLYFVNVCRGRVKVTSLSRALSIFALVTTSANGGVPAKQSECEVRAIRYQAEHAHARPEDYMNSGVMFFGNDAPPDPPQSVSSVSWRLRKRPPNDHMCSSIGSQISKLFGR